MSKFLGFLLGVVVALAGPAVFGVLAAPGGIELNAKEMALAFGLGALIFWAVVSYFSGAGALGAFVAFGTLIYCWLWIPNRTTNFLNDVPGVTNGMIEGSKQYTQNGVVPILGVISLVYAIQLIVRGVQRRRRERADAERLQREQEAAQAQQEADVAAVYPVAAGTYQAAPAYESHSRYDDLFDEPEPVQPRNQADDQTRQFPVGDAEGYEQTRTFAAADAGGNDAGEETVAAPQSAVGDQYDEPTQAVEEPTVQSPTQAAAGEQSDGQRAAAQAPVEQAGATAGAAEEQGAPVEVEQSAPAAAVQEAPVTSAQPAAPEPTTPEVPAAGQQPTGGAQATTAPVSTDEQEPTSGAQPPAPEHGEQSASAPGAEPPVSGAVEQQAPEVAERPEGADQSAEMEQPTGVQQPVEDKAGQGESETAQGKSAEAKSAQNNAGQGNAGQDNAAQGDAAPGGVERESGVSPRERVGSQYRERMEDPEDTGEFFLSSFENPAVKPA